MREYEPEASTLGHRTDAATPRAARAWRRRASACRRSRFDSMARSMSELSVGSSNCVHQRARLTGCVVAALGAVVGWVVADASEGCVVGPAHVAGISTWGAR